MPLFCYQVVVAIFIFDTFEAVIKSLICYSKKELQFSHYGYLLP